MPSQAAATLGPKLDAGAAATRRLRQRSLANLLRMGHCAPTVMQTLLDASKADAQWLVKLTAGLPGGIGNMGGECGGITAPLLLLGLRHRREPEHQGLPMVVYKGHDLVHRFTARQGTTACREIRGANRVPLRCIGVIQRAPALCAHTMSSDCTGCLAGERREAYAHLCDHWREKEFHCAQAVFLHLEQAVPVSDELRDASSAFLGGTVFTGMTCSALTAGVMALGLALGEVENSRLRVVRMIATMAAGGDAFADELNAFNRVMNLGHRLSRWFASEFGSTQCRAITQCDFSTTEGVRNYIDAGGTARCTALARHVAHQAHAMIHSAAAAGMRRDEVSFQRCVDGAPSHEEVPPRAVAKLT